MTEIVRDPDHSGGAPTIRDTGIRVVNVASACGRFFGPDFCEEWFPSEARESDEEKGGTEIVEFYPDLSLADVHAALAYYYEHA